MTKAQWNNGASRFYYSVVERGSGGQGRRWWASILNSFFPACVTGDKKRQAAVRRRITPGRFFTPARHALADAQAQSAREPLFGLPFRRADAFATRGSRCHGLRLSWRHHPFGGFLFSAIGIKKSWKAGEPGCASRPPRGREERQRMDGLRRYRCALSR